MTGITILVGRGGTVVVYGRNIVNFADKDSWKVDFPETMSTVEVGKNQNGIIALKAQGIKATLELRLLAGSPDDVFLNERANNLLSGDLSDVEIANAVTERAVRINDTVTDILKTQRIELNGGTITTRSLITENTEGDTEQGIATYTFEFSSGRRYDI